jgi:hypothetical protein
MGEGAIDFRSGQSYGQTVFFDEGVDIHHIFPQDWCKKQGITKVKKCLSLCRCTRVAFRVFKSDTTFRETDCSG